jgi:ketosteroid isomerase-like protein
MGKLSPADVSAEIRRFWDILSGKSPEKLEEMYTSSALVFTGKARRSESGRLTAVRRSRQLPNASSSRVEIGAVDVQIIGADAAIAAYTYSFRTVRAQPDGTKIPIDTPFGRATQVFQRDDKGALRIVHEHLSAAAPPAIEKGAE